LTAMETASIWSSWEELGKLAASWMKSWFQGPRTNITRPSTARAAQNAARELRVAHRPHLPLDKRYVSPPVLPKKPKTILVSPLKIDLVHNPPSPLKFKQEQFGMKY
jgi:hypothetical protein